jgi:hypothetical protein
MSEDRHQDYYDRKVRRAEETLMLFAKLVLVAAIVFGLYALIAL